MARSARDSFPIDRPPRVIDRWGDQCPTWLEEEAPVEIVVLQPLVALIAGILILIIPRLLNYIVAIYLILIGLVGLFGHFGGTPAG
jgi:hypothetical protein